MLADFLLSLVLGAMCHHYMLWATVVLDVSMALTFMVLSFSLLVFGVAVGLCYQDVCDGYHMQSELNRLADSGHSARMFLERQDCSHRLAAKAA